MPNKAEQLQSLCDQLKNREASESAELRLRNGKVVPSPSFISDSGKNMAQNQTITWVKEDVDHPKFTGKGVETLYDFFRRVDEEILRRKIVDDKEKIAVLKNRVTTDEENEVFLTLKIPVLCQEVNYDKFKKGLSQALGHSKEKGLFHVIAKHTEEVIKSHAFSRATPSLVKGYEAAREICENIRGSPWVDKDDKMEMKQLEHVLTAIFFSLRIDPELRDAVRVYDFDPNTNISTIITQARAHKQSFRNIEEKAYSTYTSGRYMKEPVRAVTQGVAQGPSRNSEHSRRPHHRGRSTSRRRQTPNRGRSGSRSVSPSWRSRNRSFSRRRPDITCDRCRLKGHKSVDCRVRLDENGKAYFNPNQYCTYHKRIGHNIETCYKYKQTQSGEDRRSSSNERR